MPRFKPADTSQGMLIPISFDRQILPGTFEYTLSYLIDQHVDLSVFEARYCNDDGGRPAYHPAVLLKIVLYAYSKGITSSRDIAALCRENVMFMALSADTRPHFTTIADFISSSETEVESLFLDVLFYCNEMGLVGKEMFAIDGCKLPSNASKEHSGKHEDLKRKKARLKKAIDVMLETHKARDVREARGEVIDQETRYIEKLQREIARIDHHLKTQPENIGPSGKERQGNITDPESAKMKGSQGIAQGYNAVAAVDNKHQVIVAAEAFGEGQDQSLLEPMIDTVRDNFEAVGEEKDIFETAKLTADAGFHTEENMKRVYEENIDAYIADRAFRKRDPRFNDIERYKERTKKERREYYGTAALFTPKDFIYDAKKRTCICPAGKSLYRNGANVIIDGRQGIKFRAPKSACRECHLKPKCLRHPERTEQRQIVFFTGVKFGKDTFTEKMKRKIDSTLGRYIYNKRIATVEPVFANIRYNLGLDRFSLRGKRKVDAQWKLFSIVHNIGKIHRYGEILG